MARGFLQSGQDKSSDAGFADLPQAALKATRFGENARFKKHGLRQADQSSSFGTNPT